MRAVLQSAPTRAVEASLQYYRMNIVYECILLEYLHSDIPLPWSLLCFRST